MPAISGKRIPGTGKLVQEWAVEGVGRRRREEGGGKNRVETGVGKLDGLRIGEGSFNSSFAAILSPFLALFHVFVSTRTCARKITGIGLSRPIRAVEAYPQGKEQMSFYME